MVISSRFLTATPFALLAILGLSQEPAQAQGAPEPIRLGAPTATFPEDFGAIQTVRELPDGRVLVADPLSKAVYLVDLAGGRRTVIGREGQGPGEYRQPDAVWPLPGDSTLLVDLGNG
ncbi:MAG TPA: 6-bladed beta-propeller, partial [Thermoanaerobaculia bacterium]|nr:6-bladed beta-propeller [Thermoanaerobaculia bacterium]